MRNMKKFLALVLAMLMILSAAVITTSAADEADYTDAAYRLAALKILKGDGNNLNLENGVTRYQAALFFVQALTGKTDAGIWNADKSVYFNDVPEYGTAIDYAYGMNLIVGRGDGTYGYNDAITYQDLLVMAVRALGYETENMVYPSGYTNAAADLGLTKNIAVDVKYKDALTRGETAQIIWDMLNIEVACTDPLSGKLVYPGEEGLLEILLDKDIPRTTLLGESFADATLAGTVVEFVEATDDNNLDADMVKVNVGGTVYDIVAADLGITADTKPTTYLGLPVTLYIDCAAENFADKYEDGDASVVFANYEEYTVVENVGNEANIKVVLKNGDPLNDKTAVTLGGTKFEHGKYAVTLKVWHDAKGWVEADAQTWTNAFASFVYTTKYIGDVEANPYAENANEFNTYGKVAYRVGEKNADEKLEVEVLYTPYEFGQYNVVEIKDEEYVARTEGFDDDMLLFGSHKKVTSTTTSIRKADGELNLDITVEGEEVESGDFMFYAYNKADNVLTVVKNCGSFENGRLTGHSETKKTVKINGTSYAFGFDGLFTEADAATFNVSEANAFRAALEAGKNNVKYLIVDNKIVYLAKADAEAAAIVGAYDFVIATTDAETVAGLLEIDVDDYTAALVDGKVYVDEDGYVTVAVLDTATGEWKLASIKSLAITYNAKTEKFTDHVDVATYAEFKEIGVLETEPAKKYAAATDALENNLFAVISEKDGVYTLGAVTTYAYTEPTAPTVVSKPAGYDALDPETIVAPTEVANPGDAPADDAEQSVKDQYAADKAAYDKYVADKAAYDYKVYAAAKAEYDEDAAEYAANTDAFAPFATAPATNGIVFHRLGRTNLLAVPGTQDEETGAYEEIRVTPASDTVIVALFSDGKIGVRVGATKNDDNHTYDVDGGANSKFLTVTNKLIVIDTQAPSTKINADKNAVSLENWATSNVGGTTQYYVFTVDSAIETDTLEDGSTEYTLVNVFDGRAKTFTDITTTTNMTDLKVGDVLYRRSIGNIDVLASAKTGAAFTTNGRTLSLHNALQGVGLGGSAKTRDEGNNAKTKISFPDAESFVRTGTLVATKTLSSVDVTAYTFNFFGLYGANAGLDQADYDFSKLVIATPIAKYADVEKDIESATFLNYEDAGIELIELSPADVANYVASPVDGQEYYFVAFALTDDTIATCNEPTEGIFNNFMLANSYNTKLLVPEVDADDYTGAKAVKLNMSVSTTATATVTALKVQVTNLLVDFAATVKN